MSSPHSIGELASLGKLLEEHRPRLLAMVRRRIDPALSSRLDPEEVLAEAYLLARVRYAAFRQQSPLSEYAWLYRIVLDCLIEAWRRETRACRDVRQAMPWPADSSLQLGLRLMESGTSPSQAFRRKELQEQVHRTLERLGSKDRDVLLMRHFDELSHREIGEVLGISESAATLRYVRALKRLKDLWTGLNGEQNRDE